MKGTIIKGIGGFYYVYAEDGETYSCKAKGAFRKAKITPLVGDEVLITPVHGEEITGSIDEILPRRSSLIRPAIANVDLILVVFAARNPDPDLTLLDRFLIRMENEGVEAVIVINKSDLAEDSHIEDFRRIYGPAGYRVFSAAAKENLGTEEIKALIKGKKAAVAGPSGAGKSSLTNALLGGIHMETGELSEKIQRGKHTTRHAELIPLGDETFIFDTPGFSSADIPNIEKEELRDLYPDFVKLEPGCRFAMCMHENEPDCAVKAAVEEGTLDSGRYERYVSFYREIKSRIKY